MSRSTRYPQEIRERAVRMVFEHEPEHPSQWATIRSVSGKFGMSAETLRHWVRQVERDQGRRPGLTTSEREQLKALERENRELRRANEILKTASAFFAAVLDRVEAVGADADPGWFPTDGLVHLDLHTDNILAGDDGTLTGIIDWEGARAGDPRFDLVMFAYDLDGHDQPVWDVVEATGIERRVLRAYVAHHALRCTSWQIRHHTDDVPRQLDRAERVLDRYEA